MTNLGNKLLSRCAIAALALVLAGCATRQAAPVEERRAPAPAQAPTTRAPVPSGLPAGSAPAAPRVAEPERAVTYTVKRGDTLAGIALEHGLDYRELAAWNVIPNPDRILVGQVLRLAPPGESPPADVPGGVVTAPLRSAPPVMEARPAPSTPSQPSAAAPPPLPAARNSETLKVAPKAIKEPYSEAAAR